ncbi:MAG: hypothetical protein NUV53_00885 [Patescibacteria group bacterium]|nr:hypothetical protein [Patescibacteria group bacterium]
MKKEKNNIAFLVVAVVALFAGWNTSSLFAWDKPTLPPTSGNTSAPIHEGSLVQAKSGKLIVGGLGIHSWQFIPSSDCLSLGGAQAWSRTGVSVGSGTCPAAGTAFSVEGGLLIEGGDMGDVLTNVGDGVVQWKKFVAPIVKIIAGSNTRITPEAGTGDVTINAIMPSMPSVPSWVTNRSGGVPHADAQGNVSWGSL